jgi:type II secretory pathway pseudopilin PulG
MKKIKAYTLIEVLVVMSIMIVLMGVAFYSYASFTETTKFNQDIADLQDSVLVLQRASMLLERDPEEYWPYGIGIDFGNIETTGRYTFFKWCSEHQDFGGDSTKGEYPYYIEGDATIDGNIPNTNVSSPKDNCDDTTFNTLVSLSGYGYGELNFKDGGVEISSNSESGSNHRFILFESVSGKAFIYDSDGTRVDEDIVITFKKNYGKQKSLIIENLTGRTKVSDTEE